MAVHFILMFVVTILSPEDGRTHGAGEMLYMVFSIQRSNVGSSQSTPTLITEEVQASKIVSLAQRIFASSVGVLDRKELRSHDLSAILRSAVSWRFCAQQSMLYAYPAHEAFQMKCPFQSPYIFGFQSFTAFGANPSCVFCP